MTTNLLVMKTWWRRRLGNYHRQQSQLSDFLFAIDGIIVALVAILIITALKDSQIPSSSITDISILHVALFSTSRTNAMLWQDAVWSIIPIKESMVICTTRPSSSLVSLFILFLMMSCTSNRFTGSFTLRFAATHFIVSLLWTRFYPLGRLHEENYRRLMTVHRVFISSHLPVIYIADLWGHDCSTCQYLCTVSRRYQMLL